MNIKFHPKNYHFLCSFTKQVSTNRSNDTIPMYFLLEIILSIAWADHFIFPLGDANPLLDNSSSIGERTVEKPKEKTQTPDWVSVFFGASNRTRTCDTHGQKYGRLTRLERFVILLVFSCSSHPFIVRRTRGTMNQLTAVRLPKHNVTGLRHI